MYKDFACRLSICIFPMHLLLVSYLSIYKGAKNFSTRLPYQNGVWYKCVICPLLSEHIVALNKYREKHPIAKVSISFISKPVNILKSTLCNPHSRRTHYQNTPNYASSHQQRANSLARELIGVPCSSLGCIFVSYNKTIALRHDYA